MTVLAHRPHGRDPEGDPTRRRALLRAMLTIAAVTLVVAAALGGVTYLAARAFVSMLP